MAAGIGRDLAECRGDGGGIRQRDPDTAGLGFVRDAGRLDLQNNRIADRRRGPDGFIGRLRHRFPGGRDAVVGQNPLGLMLCNVAAAGQRTAPLRSRGRGVRRNFGHRAALERLAPLPQGAEAARTTHRRAVARDAGGIEYLIGGAGGFKRPVPCHHDGKPGLAGKSGNLVGCRERHLSAEGRHRHSQHVHVGVRSDQAQRAAEHPRVGQRSRGEIDRVPDRGKARQKALELGDRCRSKFGQHQSCVRAAIRHQDAGAAR